MGTFAYALLIALSIAVGGDAYRPWALTVVAVVMTVGCGVMFIAVAVRVCRLFNPGALLRHLSAEGRESTRYDPARFHTRAAELATGTAAGGRPVCRRRRAPRGDDVLAVNIPRLLDCEDAWGMRIALVPSLGTPVPSGVMLFRTSAPVGRAQCRALESALAFGDVLSPASGPFGAIRAMVDIALKARSHAVNDPSRAVQALDEIEDILAELAPDIAKRETLLAAHPDASVLRDWTRSWADYVAAATDEIRLYGTGSVQIQRRLRALFDTLAGSASSSSERPCSSAARRFTVGLSAGTPIRSTAGWPAARIRRAWAGRSARRRAPSRPPSPRLRRPERGGSAPQGGGRGAGGSSHLPALLRQRRGGLMGVEPAGVGQRPQGHPVRPPGHPRRPGLIGHRLHPEHRTGTVEGLTQCGDARHRDAAGPHHRGAPDQARSPARVSWAARAVVRPTRLAIPIPCSASRRTSSGLSPREASTERVGCRPRRARARSGCQGAQRGR